METPRFYCPDLAAGRVPLDAAEARHALQSLRLHAGDAVILFDGRGRWAHGVLQDDETAPPAGRAPHTVPANAPDPGATPQQRRDPRTTRRRGRALAVVINQVEHATPPTRQLTLIVPGCKGARLDWLVEKCTELGVTRLLLTEFERSVVRTGGQHVERLRRTAIEACKQCGRLWLPELDAGVALPARLATPIADALFVAHPEAEHTFGEQLAQLERQSLHVALVVGPEGGLSPDELGQLAAAGARPVRLAEHILRVETAAIAAAAVWGEAVIR